MSKTSKPDYFVWKTKPTIYKVKAYVEQRGNNHFFSKRTMQLFNQTMKSFKVEYVADSTVQELYKISAPMLHGETVRYFAPEIKTPTYSQEYSFTFKPPTE